MTSHLRGIADDNPPSAKRLRNVHANAVRLVARTGSEFRRTYDRLTTGGSVVIPVLTSDSFPTDYAAWTKGYVAECPRAPIWLVGNEWDIEGDASWPRGEDAFVSLWNAIAPQLPAGSRYVGGYWMVDAAPSQLHSVFERLTPRPDGVDLHPYLDTQPTFEETVNWLQEAGYAVSVCEWNDSSAKGVATFQHTLDALDVTASMFLPWSSSPAVDLPGLVSPRTGRLTALGRAYREVLGE